MTQDIVTKQFTFDIAASNEATVELIQLISQAISSYNVQTHEHLCDVPSVIRYFASLHGVKL